MAHFRFAACPTALAKFAVAVALTIAAISPATARDQMDPRLLDRSSAEAQSAWAHRQLDDHAAQIEAAASRHRIPPRLLATIILNELADYDLIDQAQETLFSTGSVGMAQVNVLRAVEHGLVDVSMEEVETRRLEIMQSRLPGRAAPPMDTESLVRQIVWERLNQPEFAIEAAAREVDWLIDKINQNLDKTWARALLRGPISRQDPYANLITDLPYERDPAQIHRNQERAMALLMAAAYNTDAIVFYNFDLDNPFYQPVDRLPFFNGRTHGINAMDIFAGMLHDEKWYEKETDRNGGIEVGAVDLSPYQGCACYSSDGRNRTCENNGCVPPEGYSMTCFWQCEDVDGDTVKIRGSDGKIIP